MLLQWNGACVGQRTMNQHHATLVGWKAYTAAMQDPSLQICRLRWLKPPEPIARDLASHLAIRGKADELVVDVPCS